MSALFLYPKNNIFSMLEEKTDNITKIFGGDLLDKLSKIGCLVSQEKTKFNKNERAEIYIIYSKLLKEKGIEIKDNTESRLKQNETYLEAIERYTQAKNAIPIS